MSRRGRGRGGRLQFDGGPAECICQNCGTRLPHTRGLPCLNTKCPNCGSFMLPP